MSSIFRSGIAPVILSLLLISCSSTKTTAPSSDSSQASSLYPAWYTPSNSFEQTDSTFVAYGAAVAADSSTAVDQAGIAAQAHFVQGISSYMEELRTSIEEENNVSEPGFIFALRNAEASLSGVIVPVESVARPAEDHASFNGFSSVQISREQMVSHLDNLMREEGYESQWQGLKTRSGFSGN